jgi:3-hydroxyisobutyrate dehydrogenase
MNIAFIGLGAMGAPMALNLRRAGHALRVYDVRPVAGFEDMQKSAADAASGCELVFTSLPGPKEVEAVAKTLRPVLKKGSAWFELSTLSPHCIRAVHKDFAAIGVPVLDAPVSGGTTGAKSGKLAIWVGGERAVYDRYESVLRTIGDQPMYVGAIGAGTVAKLSHNLASFAVHTALAEIFTLGVKAGVEPLQLFRALRQGATGRKRTFDRLAENYLRGDFAPGFATRLAHKDAGLALEMAKEFAVPVKLGRAAFDELEAALARGWADQDFRIAMTMQEERAGIAPARIAAEELKRALEE